MDGPEVILGIEPPADRYVLIPAIGQGLGVGRVHFVARHLDHDGLGLRADCLFERIPHEAERANEHNKRRTQREVPRVLHDHVSFQYFRERNYSPIGPVPDRVL